MALSSLKKVLATYDHLRGRYKTVVAEKGEIQECFKLREFVFGDELKRTGKTGQKSVAFSDEFDENSLHLLCYDQQTGQAVGTLRSTPAGLMKESVDCAQEYKLDVFSDALMAQSKVISRLCVHPEYRKTSASLSLISEIYKNGLDSGTSLGLCVCEPHLYPLYRKLGFRPLERIHSSTYGGYRLPLYLILHDMDYLARIRSPFLPALKQIAASYPEEALNWYRDYSTRHTLIAPGFTPLTASDSDAFHSMMMEGLSDDGKKQLLNGAIHIECQLGDKIVVQGGGGKSLGFIKKGSLEVVKNGKTLLLLGEGDLFGEVALVLNVARTADLVAATPDTEVVLMSESSISRLSDDQDKIQVWKNLATILAERLVVKKEM